jgi:hypothetical protein
MLLAGNVLTNTIFNPHLILLSLLSSLLNSLLSFCYLQSSSLYIQVITLVFLYTLLVFQTTYERQNANLSLYFNIEILYFYTRNYYRV